MTSRQMGPRDGSAAASTAAVLLVLGALATLVTEVAAAVTGSRAVNGWIAVAAAALVTAGVLLWQFRPRLPEVAWTVLAVTMVGVVLVLDLLTRDASGGAQMAFLIPVVYAGAFLRPAAAWTVAGAAVVAHGALVLTLLEPEAAVPDSGFALVVIGAITWALTWSGRRQDALVERLHSYAAVDGLTGLVNRREFEDLAERTLIEAADVHELARVAGLDLDADSLGTGLLVADLDLFKELNDAHGHPAGDAALVHAANVLRAAVRPADVVARLGGDELAVLLPGVSADAVVERADALRRAVRDAPLRWEGQEIQVTISVGVAHTAGRPGDLETLYSAADAALYQAKRDGRNRVVPAT